MDGNFDLYQRCRNWDVKFLKLIRYLLLEQTSDRGFVQLTDFRHNKIRNQAAAFFL